ATVSHELQMRLPIASILNVALWMSPSCLAKVSYMPMRTFPACVFGLKNATKHMRKLEPRQPAGPACSLVRSGRVKRIEPRTVGDERRCDWTAAGGSRQHY